jgi:predicted enzyme related to lactoylglutathione lyase
MLVGTLLASLGGCGDSTDNEVQQDASQDAGEDSAEAGQDPSDAGQASADASQVPDATAPEGPAGPQVRGAGLGVTDLTAATSFFVDFLDLEVESRTTLADREEVVLWSKGKRGSRVTLMKFADGRNTRDVPAKLLFLVKDTAALYARLLAAGYASNFPTVAMPGVTESVAQVKGPEGYAIEISQFATESSFFIALGFAVNDVAASESFYKTALGMDRTSQYLLGGMMFGSIELPDEFVMTRAGGIPPGAAIVLMSYKSKTFNTKNHPVKSVHYVSDVAAIVANAVMAGGTVTTPVTAAATPGGKRRATIKDPDGYLVELVEN